MYNNNNIDTIINGSWRMQYKNYKIQIKKLNKRDNNNNYYFYF